MEKEGYFYLGKILKPVGIKGELLAYLDVDEPENYVSLEKIFVLIGGNLVPFLVDSIKLRHNSQVLFKLEDIEDKDQTEVLMGCGIYLPLNLLPPLSANQFYFHDIIGYEVYDKVHGFIGTIHQVLDYPRQALLQIFHQGKEILIPVADEIIQQVDKTKRTMNITTPEGLIELYMDQNNDESIQV